MAEPYLESDIAEIFERIAASAQALSGKTILMSGGQGFLGRYFTAVFAALNRGVLDRPCRLIVLDNLITSGEAGASDPGLEHVRFIKHDVIEPFTPDEHID